MKYSDRTRPNPSTEISDFVSLPGHIVSSPPVPEPRGQHDEETDQPIMTLKACIKINTDTTRWCNGLAHCRLVLGARDRFPCPMQGRYVRFSDKSVGRAHRRRRRTRPDTDGKYGLRRGTCRPNAMITIIIAGQ